MQAISNIGGMEVLEVNPEKRYPAAWWDRSGYVKVRSSFPKSQLLVKIANEVRKLRLLKAKRR